MEKKWILRGSVLLNLAMAAAVTVLWAGIGRAEPKSSVLIEENKAGEEQTYAADEKEEPESDVWDYQQLFDKTVRQMEQKIEGMAESTNLDRGYIAALSILDWVQANVSEFVERPANYNAEGKGTLQQTLETGHGSCGGKAYAFNALAKALGYDVRTIQIYNIAPYEGGMTSHVVSEMYYKDKWRFYDPTYSMYFLDENNEVMSYNEILELSQAEIDRVKRIDSYTPHYFVDSFSQGGGQKTNLIII